MDIMDMDFNEVLEYAIAMFYEKYKYEKISYEIVWTDDVHLKYLELETNDKLKEARVNDIDTISTTCGTIVMPQKIGDISYILLNNSETLKYTFQYIRVAIHELVHIYDCIDFANEFCNSDLSAMVNHDLYLGHFIWSEFHANRIGYDIYYNIMSNVDDAFSPENISESMQYDNPYDEHTMEQLLFEGNKPALYTLGNFIGHLLAVDEISNDVIDLNEFVSDIVIAVFPSLYKLYSLLSQMKTFESAKSNFNEVMKLQRLMENRNTIFSP